MISILNRKELDKVCELCNKDDFSYDDYRELKDAEDKIISICIKNFIKDVCINGVITAFIIYIMTKLSVLTSIEIFVSSILLFFSLMIVSIKIIDNYMNKNMELYNINAKNLERYFEYNKVIGFLYDDVDNNNQTLRSLLLEHNLVVDYLKSINESHFDYEKFKEFMSNNNSPIYELRLDSYEYRYLFDNKKFVSYKQFLKDIELIENYSQYLLNERQEISNLNLVKYKMERYKKLENIK